MAYRSDPIAMIIKRLNNQYFLPAIQREFVWKPEQIIQLFDSVLCEYPISSFLFWELQAENKDRWEVYKFIDNYKQGTHNEPVDTAGISQLTLVLDGQQRLTSFLLGLKGSYEIKKKWQRNKKTSAWNKQFLYLNLLHDPERESEEEQDSDLSTTYMFKFLEKAPETEKDGSKYWFRISRILEVDGENHYYKFREDERERLPESTTKRQLSLFDKTLDRLYQSICKENAISFHTETIQDYDRVLDIFVRANEGGTKLSKSDLLLSMITSSWTGNDARDEIYSFVDRLNKELLRKNDLDKDFVMKTCLVLCDLPVKYKVENFNNKNLQLIRSKWKEIKAAIEGAVELVNSFGIDKDTLSSANVLIPICYYFFIHGIKTLRGSTVFDSKNAEAIRQWLIMCLLNRAFAGHTDSVLAEMRKIIQAEKNANSNFPFEALTSNRSKATLYIAEQLTESFGSLRYGDKETFLALSLLYKERHWGTTEAHIDHIFPQSLFKLEIMNKHGISKDKQSKYFALEHRLGNLELLLGSENTEKSDQDFDEWVKTREHPFYDRHLIPQNVELNFLMFEEFVTSREQLINNRLKEIFPTKQLVSEPA